METKVERLPKSHVKLKIKLNHQELSKYLEVAYEKVGKSLKIDGFRPGKAPKKVIEEAAGQARIIQETVDMALEESYPKAVQEEKLYPLNQPKISIESFPTLTEGDLSYVVEFDSLPEAKLNDYLKIKVKKVPQESAKEADVDKVIEYLRKQKSTFREVDRPVQNGDRVEINFEGMVKGVKKEGMSSKNHPLIIGEKVMIPGFEDEIIGLKKGDKKTFKIKFPKDYHAKDLAGEPAEFNVEVVDHKEVRLPEVDTEMAKTFGHQNVKAMKDAIKDSLQKELDEKRRQTEEIAVLNKVLPLLTVDVPESLVEQELDRMFTTFRQQVEAQGLNFEKYLESLKKDQATFRSEMKTQAEKNVRIGFLIGEVIKERKLDPHKPESGKQAVEYLVRKVVN